jgi:hypothetical protein
MAALALFMQLAVHQHTLQPPEEFNCLQLMIELARLSLCITVVT